MTDHFLAPSLCPQCGDKLDAATNMPGETGAPEPSDITGCLNCGAVLTWDTDMRLRKLSSEEFDEIPAEQKKQLIAFLLVRKMIVPEGQIREQLKQ